MKALLVRVGIDQTFGRWNGPVDNRSNEFVYVSIPEIEMQRIREGMEKPYSALIPALSKFGVSLPAHLSTQHMHLDPDFDYLTYGDVRERAKQLSKLVHGDMIVFYASLKDVRGNQLVYAIIGVFVVDEIISATSVPASAWDTNAHSRRILPEGAKDLIVRAQPNVSGRLRCCIPIGEYRDKAYRVRHDILKAWGGLLVKDGYIQRSVYLPKFCEPERFLRWFQSQAPVLLQTNN